MNELIVNGIVEVPGIGNRAPTAKEVQFKAVDGQLDVSKQSLLSIDVPEGIVNLRCNGNLLTDIILPSTLHHLDIADNSIENLNLPTGIKQVSINQTLIKSINLPTSVTLFYGQNTPLRELIIPNHLTKPRLKIEPTVIVSTTASPYKV